MVFEMNKKFIRDLKRYSQVGTIALSAVVTIAMGVGLGMLLDYLFENSIWIVICSVGFLFIAIANFIYQIYKLSKW